MIVIQLRAGQTSQPQPVGIGSNVIFTPQEVGGGTGYFEYTLDSEEDIKNNIAIWSLWPGGVVNSNSTQTARFRFFVRGVCTAGNAEFAITSPTSSVATPSVPWAASGPSAAFSTFLEAFRTVDIEMPAGALSLFTYDDIQQANGVEYTGGAIVADRSGRIIINASIGTTDDLSGLTMAIFKNGIPLDQATFASVTGAPFTTAPLTVFDDCNPSDVYEVYVIAHGAAGLNYNVISQNDMTFLRAGYI